MSGHNKWANIKQRKGAQDAKRSNLFSKIVKEIILAARAGGVPETNARLRAIIDKARAANMPRDNIEKAIKRGTGELGGVTYEELTYEGYGPAGVAIIMDVTTDNKNRSAAEIRKLFSKHNSAMGEAGSVGWMFKKKGYIAIDGTKHTEDQVMEVALELGADDVKTSETDIEVYTSVESYLTVLDALKEKGFTITANEFARFPENTIKVDRDAGLKLLKLIDDLEEHDDVQNVAHNADIDDAIIEEYANM